MKFYLLKSKTPKYLTTWFNQILQTLNNSPRATQLRSKADYLILGMDTANETIWPFYNQVAGMIVGNGKLQYNIIPSEWIVRRLCNIETDKPIAFFTMNMLRGYNNWQLKTNKQVMAIGLHHKKHYNADLDVSFPPMPFRTYGLTDINTESEYLISFKGNNSSPLREKLLYLNQYEGCRVLIQNDRPWGGNINAADQDVGKCYTQEYDELNLKSKFALVVRGDVPFSYRLLEVMCAGAIPVILSDDWVLPFSEIIDYSQFAVIVEEKNYDTIMQTINAMSEEEILSKRRLTLQVYDTYFESFEKQIATLMEIIDLKMSRL